jgi:hypothetical protein
MMLAFVPSLLLAALWLAAVDRVRGGRLVNLGIGLAAFGATSGGSLRTVTPMSS